MNRRWPIPLVATLVVAASCDPGARLPQLELSGATMGTTFSVKLPAPPDALPKEPLQQEIRARLDGIEKLASTYLTTSELSLFNTSDSTDWHAVSAELCRAFESALAISRQTDGAFDITVGPLVNLWGFGAEDVVFEPPSQTDIDRALTRVGYSNLETDCTRPAVRKHHADLYVDLSGWAKGYAVDEVAAILDRHALTDYLVEIGGELRLRGHNAEQRKWAVGIEQPVYSRRGVQAAVRITDRAVATSGDYRNFFEFEGTRYSHTIDPRSGRPVDHALAAVTVFDRCAASADALATALLVLGPQAGPERAERLHLAAVFLLRDSDGVEQISTPAFNAMIAP